jgi:AraC-like DNA-binding protein
MQAIGRRRRNNSLRLFEHPDFEQAILQAAEHFRERNLRPAIIEKDYYVTEALRVIATTSGDKIIFKGGTSLAKGWNLIQRFSEDIDIFLDPTAFQPALGKNAIDRELKKLRNAVGQHPALSFVERESQTIGGFGRNDHFSYTQRFGGPGEVANRVLLEAGTASGREPSAVVELRSYLGQFFIGFIGYPHDIPPASPQVLEPKNEWEKRGRFSAEEIARKNGFGNRERMRRSFVRAFGQSPQTIQRTVSALVQYAVGRSEA